MSKLTDDPRVDPRIKAFMGHWPVARGRDVGSRAEVLEEAMERESRYVSASAGTSDAQEGIAAFLAKRSARFEGR